MRRPIVARGDLARRADIHDLVVAFYREIVFDDLLAPVFDEVADVDWAVHILAGVEAAGAAAAAAVKGIP